MGASFHFDSASCIGCEACVVACKQWHGTPAGTPGNRAVIATTEGVFPDVHQHFVSRALPGCDRCRSIDGEPRCALTCATGALTFE